MNLRVLLLAGIFALLLGSTLRGQERSAAPPLDVSQNAELSQTGEPSLGNAQKADTSASANNPKAPPVQFFGNWRFRAEGWDWFQPSAGEHAYAFAYSLLRAGLSQTVDRPISPPLSKLRKPTASNSPAGIGSCWLSF